MGCAAPRRRPDTRDCAAAADEIERLRNAVAQIKQATLDGEVCDDVAWFSDIETLHDFCESTLNPETV